MATRIHRILKVIIFNANGIGRQHYQLSKQLQDQNIDVALFLETHLKPRERFYIPNYNFFRIGRHSGMKGGTADAIRKGIPHNTTRIRTFGNKSKAIWDIIKEEIGSQKKPKGNIIEINIDGENIKDPKIIANVFNQQV
jgi:exonuclease III